jgi:hypothetical protein
MTTTVLPAVDQSVEQAHQHLDVTEVQAGRGSSSR